MSRVLDVLKASADFLLAMVPRFATDWVGCIESEDGAMAHPLYPMQIWHVAHDGIPDAVCRIRSFQILGWSICGRVIGQPMSYREWLDHMDREEAGRDE